MLFKLIVAAAMSKLGQEILIDFYKRKRGSSATTYRSPLARCYDYNRGSFRFSKHVNGCSCNYTRKDFNR